MKNLASIPFLVLALCLCGAWGRAAEPGESFRVMTFNIWVGGEKGGLPLSRTAEVIRAARADIVGVQEVLGREHKGERPDNSKALADLLGWNLARQEGSKAILSRFDIAGLTPDKQGAEIRLDSGRRVYVFNVHLYHAPYQPYQLLRIPYEDAPFLSTEAELISAAKETRGAEIERALQEIRPLLGKGAPVLLTGDFNEPSHQDWTPRAAAAGLVPLPVRYPTTEAIVAAGLRDAYRDRFPDETTHRGLTWTPTTAETDPKDRHDRIDLVFASPAIAVQSSQIVGEGEQYADIVLSPYPSDHRAVVCEVTVQGER